MVTAIVSLLGLIARGHHLILTQWCQVNQLRDIKTCTASFISIHDIFLLSQLILLDTCFAQKLHLSSLISLSPVI